MNVNSFRDDKTVVAANFDGIWRKWGVIDKDTIKLVSPETVFDVMEQAKLTFPVLQAPLKALNPFTNQIENLPGKALFRGDTGEHISTVGEHYSVVPYYDVIRGILDDTTLAGTFPARALSFDNGARMMMQFFVKDVVVAERAHNTFLTISNGYDGKTPFKGGWSIYTPICQNTYVAALRELTVSRRHSKGFSNYVASDLRYKLGIISKELDQTVAALKRASKTPVNSAVVNEFISMLIPPTQNKASENRQADWRKSLDATLQEVGANRVTAYDLFAATTRYIADRKDDLEYVMVGPGHETAQRAMSWVTEYVQSY